MEIPGPIEVENSGFGSKIKELDPLEHELLNSTVAELMSLNKAELESPLRDSFFSGNLTLPEGTLIHGVQSFSEKSLRGIARNGVLTSEMVGIPEDSESDWCADFFRVPAEMNLPDYLRWTAELEDGASSLIRRKRMESSYLPGEGDSSLGIVFDIGIPEISNLLKNDAYRPTEGLSFDKIITGLPIDIEDDRSKRVAAILGGLPRGAIAGIVVGGRIANNSQQLEVIKGLFPDLPVFNYSGDRIF